MGRRNEQRIAISFPVIVRGVDVRGARFTVTTKTRDISFSGATLTGLNDIVAPGAKIEIECHGERAQYRVVWVGQRGQSNAERIGVRCLELGKYVWGVPPKEWEPDTYDPANPTHPAPIPDAPVSSYDGPRKWAGKERRQFARHHCRIEALVTVESDSVEMPGKITDISLGGCYVEMLSPLPDGTPIRITLSPREGTLKLSGKVCSSQTGFGMGIAFTGMGPEDFEKLRKLAPPAAEEKPVAKTPQSQPAPQPQITAASESASHVRARSYASAGDDALDLTPTADALEALVRLLIRKEVFTLGELAEELEKFKVIQR